MISYGSRLKELRKRTGQSQQEYAENIGLSQSTYSYSENSTFPSLETIYKVCEHLGIEVWEFFIDPAEIEERVGLPIEYIEFIKAFLTLPDEDREALLEGFKNMVVAFQSKKDQKAK